jgi:exopolysaccharide biosynthesis protein
MRYAAYQTRRKKTPKIVIALFVLLAFFVSSALCVLLVYYGPYPVIRKYVVGTAMSSKSHQYLAKWFLSDAQIEDILKTNYTDIPQNKDKVVISNIKSNEILESTVDGGGQFKGYVLTVKNPFRLKVGVTSKLGEYGETTSQIAKNYKAVAAINGGGFHDNTKTGGNWTGTGAYPTYFVISDGKVVYKEVSEDYMFNSKADKNASVVAFDNSGKLIVGKHSINELLSMNVKQALVFGPTLVVNGKETFSGDGSSGTTARTAIGQCANGDIILLVVDGRRIIMPGATLGDMRDIMLKLGAVNAVSLDGGSSTTMYYNSKVINDPVDALGERTIPDAIYIS